MPFKNDNFEELFKKAARDYPLKTDNSNWNRVASDLNKSFKEATAKNKILSYAMAVIILAFAAGTLTIYKFNSNSIQAHRITAKTENKNAIKKANIKVDRGQTEEIKNASKPVASNNNASFNAVRYSNQITNNNSLYSSPLPLILANNQNKYAIDALVNKPSPSYKLISIPSELNFSDRPEEDIYKDDVLDQYINSVGQDDNTAIKSVSKMPKRVETQNDFYKIYGSLYGGPQFSMVKFQQIDKPGYKIGVSIGYRLNNRLSIEVGLQREHINFYSDGKYLDTSMLRIKSNTNVDNVNASSKLTSVPLSLRYNFLSKSRGNFFVTGGINAIIITHSEQYNYAVSKDGVPADFSKHYSALTPPKYFSGVNASVGYQLELTGFGSMKVESYYQSPVNNLGVGQLPVTSFGINVGIVKNLK